MTGTLVALVLILLLVNKFLNRNNPRVGGRIGRRKAPVALPLPDGFSRVTCREITVFLARSAATDFPSLKAYLRGGIVKRIGLVDLYQVAACSTRIEIPATTADYERIDAVEALALLRELPDPRLVHRLQLSDDPSFLDPWIRMLSGREVMHLGNATSTSLVVLYRPDRRLGRELAVTLLHEWLHLVAFSARGPVRRFKRADAVEPLAPLNYAAVSLGDPRTPVYEAWCELGERLFGDDAAAAQQAALAAPLHATILWRQVEKILRKVPRRLASTRLAQFDARLTFMREQVAPLARAARARRRWWR
jgi:hypothetical protein